MILHEIIKNNKVLINQLYRSGAMNLKALTDFEIYNYYLDALKIGGKSAVIAMAAKNFDVSERHIYRAIKNMEHNAK